MNTLEIKNLSKKFGNHKVLDNLSLSVPEHSIFGFLGQNGAGKTTTMKLILGLLKPDGGSIHVMGKPVTYGQTATNCLMGYLPDVPEFYGYMTPMEYLSLCGEIAGLSKKIIQHRSHTLLELVGLEINKKKISGFSRGMKQRLGIAQALLGSPKLLICDEPTSALDPMGRKEILDILQRVKGKTTVLFSTHILSDAERVCDRVAILHQSHLALCGELNAIKKKKTLHTLSIRFSNRADLAKLAASPLLLSYRNAMQVQGLRLCINANDMAALQHKVISLLHSEGLLPMAMEIAQPSLENIFMEVIR